MKSKEYWEHRYASGSHSGIGSRGQAAAYKAGVVNGLVAKHDVDSVLDMGCGDGYVLGMLKVNNYTGVDVSTTVLDVCSSLYPEFSFLHYDSELPTADMVLSMDVILHLVEDDVFEDYMNKIFGLAERVVVLYTTNRTDNEGWAPHIKHRDVVLWIETNIDGWVLDEFQESPIPDNISAADFYVYKKADTNG